MRRQLAVQLSEEGADAERLDMLTGFLRQELLQLDVAEVTGLAAGEPPPGSRGLDPAMVGGLLVTFMQSTDVLRMLITSIRNWLSRGMNTDRVVRIKLGDDEIEIRDPCLADEERLVELFISKHAAERD